MTRFRKLRLLAVLLLLLGAGLLALGAAFAPRLAAGLLARGLSALFERPASVGQVRLRLFPLEAEILDVRVAGATPEAPPFLELPRAVAAPALSGLLGRRVVLARLRLHSPRIRVHAFAGGGDDIPRLLPGGSAGSGLEFRVRRLAIDAGELVLDHQRVPLQLHLPDFAGRLARRPDGALAGRISFGPGRLRFGSNPLMRVATDVELSLKGRTLAVENGRLRAEGTDLEYEGELRLMARPQGAFELRGPVDLALLDRHVMRSGFGIKGRARFLGRLSVDGSRLRLAGRMQGGEGEFDGVPLQAYDGELAWNESGVQLKQLALTALGGSGTLDLELPPGASVARLRAALDAVDAETTLRWIFDLGPLDVGASATGEVSLEWPRGRFRELSGRIAADLRYRNDGRTPLEGQLLWRAERGVQWLEPSSFSTPTDAARLEGRIDIDERADLQVAAESRDLAAADALLTRLRRALGAADAQRTGIAGSGTFRGRMRGTLEQPLFEGDFAGGDVSYLGVSWGSAAWTGSLSSEEARSKTLVLRKDGAELRLTGSSQTGYYGERDGVDLRAHLRAWPAQDLVRALGWELKLSGPLSGEAEIKGRRSAPEGNARVRGTNARYYGVPVSEFEVASVFAGGATHVERGRARVGGGEVVFAGALTDDGFYDGKAEAAAVDIAGVLPPDALGVPLTGRVSGTLVLLGPLSRPRLLGRFHSQRLFLADEGIGELSLELRGAGDGALAVSGRCLSPRVDLALRGSIGLDAEFSSRLELTARGTSIDPFLRARFPALPPVVGIVADAELGVAGPLRRPRALRATLLAPALTLELPDYPVRNREPLRVLVEDGRAELAQVRLAGEGTDLSLSGGASLVDDASIAVDVRGAADLRTLSLVTRRLRGQGAARLAMSVRGTRAEPRVDGTLLLEGAGLRVRGFPHGLEGVRGRLRFDETSARVEEVGGSLGGGELSLSGELSYRGGQLTSLDLTADGRGISLRYPEGLRSAVDADLRLFGDGARQWLSGAVQVRHALWTQRYDVASELLAARERREDSASLREGLRYDIKLHAPGTLEIDNNLATLHARADLQLQGDSENPVVLGRAEIDRGRVYFQGNTYTIRRGSIDFTNPHRSDPQFDIEAEARVRSYRVTLKVNGTLDRVYPTLSSDPPLSAVQIVSLLAGAEDPVVDSLSLSQAEQARLAAAGAATLAAAAGAEQVGLERQAERLFGLNRFSIDPTLVRGNVTNPKARLTVGKRLTPDLNVLYSVDLGGTEERLLSVEYTLSDRFSLLLTQSERGVGFDLRIRQTQ
jgi:translocation and assembly module TamB